MFPHHYAVPDSLNIHLVGYVRWGWDKEGHYITTLWRAHGGECFYYEDLWNPYSPPFWLDITVQDLTPCTSEQFCDHVEAVCAAIRDEEEQVSVYFRYRELLTVWGVLEGMEAGFAWMIGRKADPDHA